MQQPVRFLHMLRLEQYAQMVLDRELEALGGVDMNGGQ